MKRNQKDAMNKNEQKRLVLIGIRRKGENGFKKRIDTRIPLVSGETQFEEKSAVISPAQVSNAGRIIRIIPG